MRAERCVGRFKILVQYNAAVIQYPACPCGQAAEIPFRERSIFQKRVRGIDPADLPNDLAGFEFKFPGFTYSVCGRPKSNSSYGERISMCSRFG